MPILHFGPNNELYEVGGEVDRNRRSEFVEEDDVLKLSLKDDPQTRKGRELVKKQKANKLIREIKARMKKFAKAARRMRLEEADKQARQNVQNRLAQKFTSKRNALIEQGLRQGYNMPEKLSGLSGYGESSDGSWPYLNRPARDFQQIYNVDQDFGNLLYGDKELGAGATGASTVEKQPAKPSPIDVKEFSSYSQRDQFIIDMFKDGKYTVQTENVNNPSITYNHVFEDSMKALIYRFNSTYNGTKYMSDRVRAGWMYSGYHDENGNWVSVKVPYLYGIPMDRPDHPDKSKRDTWRNKGRQRYDSFKYFDSLKEVIKALGRQYAYQEGTIKPEEERKRLEYEVKTLPGKKPTAVDTPDGAKSVMSKKDMKEMAKSKSDYSHPMMKRGLLK